MHLLRENKLKQSRRHTRRQERMQVHAWINIQTEGDQHVCMYKPLFLHVYDDAFIDL
jgi:hypothetical protein